MKSVAMGATHERSECQQTARGLLLRFPTYPTMRSVLHSQTPAHAQPSLLDIDARTLAVGQSYAFRNGGLRWRKVISIASDQLVDAAGLTVRATVITHQAPTGETCKVTYPHGCRVVTRARAS